jgi:hypothetical protein
MSAVVVGVRVPDRPARARSGAVGRRPRRTGREADRRAHCARDPNDGVAGDARAAGVELEQRRQDIDQRRLAGSVRAEQREQAAARHAQIDVGKRLRWAEPPRNLLDLNHDTSPFLVRAPRLPSSRVLSSLVGVSAACLVGERRLHHGYSRPPLDPTGGTNSAIRARRSRPKRSVSWRHESAKRRHKASPRGPLVARKRIIESH